LQGCLFEVGDYIVCTGVGFASVMTGTVTAFNPVTGIMTATIDAATNGGTGTTAIAKIGESADMKALISAFDPLFGGTGAGGTFSRNGADLSSVFGSAQAGEGSSLWDAMIPIYEECFIVPRGMNATGTNAPNCDNQQNTPWFLYNCIDRTLNPSNLTEGAPNKTAGGICLCMDQASLQSAIASWGDRGSISTGKGALRYECVIRADYDGKMIYRMGLKGEGSSRTNNIFGYSGIGFELNPVYGGYLNLVVGTHGAVYREKLVRIAQGLTTGKNCRLAFETDQEGTQCDFYVNDVYAATYTGTLPNGTQDQRDLMYPAFEIALTTSRSAKGLFIDTLDVRKTLSR
jgi:hypothetical protein